MTASDTTSHRDWFRLRLRKSLGDPGVQVQLDDSASKRSVGQTAAGLQDIPHPENHDGMDLSELPPMREAVLSSEQVAHLFSDIEALGTDILLMQRASRSARATGSTATSKEQLQLARTSLLAAAITRLQIRYRWQDTAWIDTLEAKPDGYRLIRIAHRERQ